MLNTVKMVGHKRHCCYPEGVDKDHSGCFKIEECYSILGRVRRFYLRLNIQTGCKAETFPYQKLSVGETHLPEKRGYDANLGSWCLSPVET
jgi:hypothetical protein